MTKSDDETVSTQAEEQDHSTVVSQPSAHSDLLEGTDILGYRAGNQVMPLEDDLEREAQHRTTGELRQLTRMIDNEIRVMRRDLQMIAIQSETKRRKIRENQDKIQVNTQLPLLVATVVEVLPIEGNDEGVVVPDRDGDGQAMDGSASRSGVTVVIKTSTRQTMFLPHPGLVPPEALQPGDLVGVNKDSYLIFEKLPDEFDGRVKAMEIDDRPRESYADIAGCDEQIQELIEAVVLPMTHKDMFETIGIRPPKGVLLHGPPGTGKTMLARACANSTNATFFRLAGPTLVQMYIGEGSRMIRQAFELAKQSIKDKESEGAILFIDELDAIGTKRYGGDESGEREVQRTMLELLNQLDGFTPNDQVKVIAATNRPDILDPALLRSGRLDRKIELPMPSESARERMFYIHSRRMHVSHGAEFSELASSCDGFNGAQIKAVCVEAGMLALRREASAVGHEDFVEAIAIVAAKKKGGLEYFA